MKKTYFCLCCLQVTLLFALFLNVGVGGDAPPEGTSSANTTLSAAIDLCNRVCACAADAVKKSSSALTNIYQGVFPGQVAPKEAEALAAPFAEANVMTNFIRTQTVRGSELTFRLLLGHGISGDFEAAASDFPRRPDGKFKSLTSVKDKATQLAGKLIDTFERKLAESAAKKGRAPSGSAM